ncbi:hypothetical protein [Anaerovibrio sp.]|uniref:hypothetical protein n=1 Tax=Anaerovibrio sp. TaxID=1872532 RepID=UPI003F181BDC
MRVWRDFLFKLSGIGMAIVLAVILAGILPSQTCHAADGMRFIGVSKTYLLGCSTDQIDLKLHDGEKVSVLVSRLRELVFYSTNRPNPGFRLSSYDGDNEGTLYNIKELYTNNPNITIYQIMVSKGAHDENHGYWLIGRYHGKWFKFMSMDNLVTMGHTPNEWHQFESKITKDGKLRIISSHEQRRVDMELEVSWDEKAQWFAMKRIQ